MRQHSLQKTGLSLSSAQAISNLCNQKATEINNLLESAKTASKTIQVDGKEFSIQKAIKLPINVYALLFEKATLHACQAFLMENIKAKEMLLRTAKTARPDLSEIEEPECERFAQPSLLSSVSEEWGWEQLSSTEMNEFYQVEALAAHIGQFIHKGSKLDKLRTELTNLSEVEWMELEVGKKTPITVTPNHTSTELFELHTLLAKEHKVYEQKTNYYKAKVKNLVTIENGRIAKLNADENDRVNLINKEISLNFDKTRREYNQKCSEISNNFEKSRTARIQEIVGYRINVDPRFQSIINLFDIQEEK